MLIHQWSEGVNNVPMLVFRENKEYLCVSSQGEEKMPFPQSPGVVKKNDPTLVMRGSKKYPYISDRGSKKMSLHWWSAGVKHAPMTVVCMSK